MSIKRTKPQKKVDLSVIFRKEDLELKKIMELKDAIYRSIKLRRQFEKIVDSFSEETQKELSSKFKAMTRKGIAYWILNKIPEALALFKDTWSSKETNYFLARCYQESNKVNQAYDLLKSLYQDHPHDPLIFFSFIDAKIKKGDLEEALEILQKSSKEFREEVDLYYYTGLCLEYLGRYQEADSAYKQALRISPSHPPTLFRQAYNADLRGEDERALELYEKLRSLRPPHLNTLINLGLLYEDKEDYQKAVDCYQLVLKYHDAHHPRVRLYLKDTYASMNMYYDEELKQRERQLNRLLQTPLSDFQVSARSRDCLKRLKINTLGDLAKKTEKDLLKTDNFGLTSLAEMKELLGRHGLSLAPDKMLVSPGPTLKIAAPSDAAKLSDVLNKLVAEFEWSARNRKTLEQLKIYTIGDLIKKTENELLAMRNMGQTSLTEIKQRLNMLGLSLKTE